MKLTIHPTHWVVDKPLRPGRTERLYVWDGTAEDGTPCRLFVWALTSSDPLWDARGRATSLLARTVVGWREAIEQVAPRDPNGPEIVVEPLPYLQTLCGVDVRRWTGRTDRGVACSLYVHLVATRQEHCEQFARYLAEMPSPIGGKL